MDKFRTERQRLMWMIDFANQNIKELSTGDFLKAHAEMQENIKSLYSQIAFEKGEDRLVFDGERAFSIEGGGYSLEDTPQARQILFRIQDRLRAILETICDAQEDAQEAVDVEIPRSMSSHKGTLKIIIMPGGLFAGRVATKIDLMYEIVKLLYDCSPPTQRVSGIPFHSIKNLKRCQIPECNKFFWQAHKKEKHFCSNKCAWIAHSRSKRAKIKKTKPRHRKED
jgi:hypothetical protein